MSQTETHITLMRHMWPVEQQVIVGDPWWCHHQFQGQKNRRTTPRIIA
jgi:hypothetical protein